MVDEIAIERQRRRVGRQVLLSWVTGVAVSAFDVIGREAEIASLTAWIAERSALPAAYVLEGEAGMGKTTLWRHGIELASAASYRVLTASPSEPEAQLSFAALSDLLEPVLDEVLAVLGSDRGRRDRRGSSDPCRSSLANRVVIGSDHGRPPATDVCTTDHDRAPLAVGSSHR